MEPQDKLDSKVHAFVTCFHKAMLQDERCQVAAVERISNLFKSRDDSDREKILAKLISCDILSSLLELLQKPSDRLVSAILSFLSLVSVHRRFYDNNIAIETVDSMLKIVTCTLKSRSRETRSLKKLVLSVGEILHRATEFELDLDSVCVPQQVLRVLRILMDEKSSDQALTLAGVPLLNTILGNTSVEEFQNDEAALELGRQALDLMREIVEYSDDDTSVSVAASLICGICTSGTRFCSTEDDEDSQEFASELKKTLANACYAAIMNTIIPYLKTAELTETSKLEFHINLVPCLNNLYKMRSCSHDNLSNHLTANGYLKRFLLLTAGLPERRRRSTCTLLTNIITTIAGNSMSIGQIEFSNLLRRGLLALPRDPEKLIESIARQGNDATALMILIYYHFLGTAENDMISLKSLISNAINLSDMQPIPAHILKSLWVLFAAASVSHPGSNSEENYDVAVKRLSSALQRSKVDDCYTHHIVLLHFCLQCVGIPKNLLSTVINLWLIESHGDIKSLLAFDCDKVVGHCLRIIEIGHDEAVINLVMSGLRKLMNTESADKIGHLAWHMLPNLLSAYHPGKDASIKAALELTNLSKPVLLPLTVTERCADVLLEIILRKDTDVKLKSLVVMQAYVLLVTSVTRQSFRVLEKYISALCFLEELCEHSFSCEFPELSAICLKLLAFIVHCQENCSVNRVKPITLDVRILYELLHNTKKSPLASINAVKLVLELLTQNIDGSVVRLEKIAWNTKEVEEVVNLYEMLHIIHLKTAPDEMDTVYRCLQAVLNFSQVHVENLMYHMCTLMSNYFLVTYTFDALDVSSPFIEFVSTWLRYRNRYCTDEGAWNERSLCKTPFEKTLDRITKYVDSINDSRVDDAHYKLKYAFRQFKE